MGGCFPMIFTVLHGVGDLVILIVVSAYVPMRIIVVKSLFQVHCPLILGADHC